MASRESIISEVIASSTPNAKEALVFTKIAETGAAIVDYFSDFKKVTNGQKSIADDTDETLSFVANCYKGTLDFPEILSGTFNKADFAQKVVGLMHFFLFQAKIQQVINDQWNNSVMICKTDAMYYANEFYSIIQKEAGRDPKYKPLADSLKVYYKKVRKEKAV